MKKASVSRRTKWSLISVIAMAAIYSINAFLILPLVRMLASDIMYSNTFLLIVLEYFAEIIEVCAVSICYAFLLATMYSEGKTRRVFVSFGLLTAYKNFATTAMIWIEAGKAGELWIWELVDDLYFTALELVLLLIIFQITKRIIGVYTDKREVAQRVFKKTGEMPELEVVYPFVHIYDRANCLLKSAAVCAIATFIAKALGEVANDVLYIASSGFPREGITWVYMIVNYVSKALFGVLVYITVCVSLNVMLKDEK